MIFGLLLLILAVRSFFGEDDPDAPPPKFMTILDKMGPVKLFGVGVVLWLMQFRFIALVLVGAVVIAEARQSTTENLISVLVLALLMVWPMLIPVVVFLVLGERREIDEDVVDSQSSHDQCGDAGGLWHTVTGHRTDRHF